MTQVMKVMKVNSMVNFMKEKILGGNSLVLAGVYTLGHICIAMTVVSVMTGASLWESGLVALIEPAINGVWFYVLHTAYTRYKNK